MGLQKIPKKGLPLVAKNLVWKAFLENQDSSEKLNTITDLLIQEKSGFFMAFTLNFRIKMGKKSHISSLFLGSVQIFQN